MKIVAVNVLTRNVQVAEENLRKKMICDYCDWNTDMPDETGMDSYCLLKDIYSDGMEKIKDCYNFRWKEETKQRL